MKKEKRPAKVPLDVKYNLRVYWSFLRKEKSLFIGVMLAVLAMTIFAFASRYLFKTVVDKGELYAKNKSPKNLNYHARKLSK